MECEQKVLCRGYDCSKRIGSAAIQCVNTQRRSPPPGRLMGGQVEAITLLFVFALSTADSANAKSGNHSNFRFKGVYLRPASAGCGTCSATPRAEPPTGFRCSRSDRLLPDLNGHVKGPVHGRFRTTRSRSRSLALPRGGCRPHTRVTNNQWEISSKFILITSTFPNKDSETLASPHRQADWAELAMQRRKETTRDFHLTKEETGLHNFMTTIMTRSLPWQRSQHPPLGRAGWAAQARREGNSEATRDSQRRNRKKATNSSQIHESKMSKLDKKVSASFKAGTTGAPGGASNSSAKTKAAATDASNDGKRKREGHDGITPEAKRSPSSIPVGGEGLEQLTKTQKKLNKKKAQNKRRNKEKRKQGPKRLAQYKIIVQPPTTEWFNLTEWRTTYVAIIRQALGILQEHPDKMNPDHGLFSSAFIENTKGIPHGTATSEIPPEERQGRGGLFLNCEDALPFWEEAVRRTKAKTADNSFAPLRADHKVTDARAIFTMEVEAGVFEAYANEAQLSEVHAPGVPTMILTLFSNAFPDIAPEGIEVEKVYPSSRVHDKYRVIKVRCTQPWKEAICLREKTGGRYVIRTQMTPFKCRLKRSVLQFGSPKEQNDDKTDDDEGSVNGTDEESQMS